MTGKQDLNKLREKVKRLFSWLFGSEPSEDEKRFLKQLEYLEKNGWVFETYGLGTRRKKKVNGLRNKK